MAAAGPHLTGNLLAGSSVLSSLADCGALHDGKGIKNATPSASIDADRDHAPPAAGAVLTPSQSRTGHTRRGWALGLRRSRGPYQIRLAASQGAPRGPLRAHLADPQHLPWANEEKSLLGGPVSWGLSFPPVATLGLASA